MFIGHLAVGFAAKRFAPKTGLGWLLLASEMSDLLFSCFFILGWERMRIAPENTAATPLAFDHYPYSHSLATTLLYAAALSLLYWSFTRYRAGTFATFVVITSHWLLDVFTHIPDTPLYPGGSVLIGFGLWNLLPGTLLVEGAMFLVGTGMYFSLGNARDRIGIYGAVSLIAVIVMLYASGTLGPLPPSALAVAVSGLALTTIIPAWAEWVDRHRVNNA
jgi:membrane-bound metal-dependent hydrolase YbcI (DUF457 family)